MASSFNLAVSESLAFDVPAISATKAKRSMTSASPPLQGEDLGGDGVTQVRYDAVIHAIALAAECRPYA